MTVPIHLLPQPVRESVKNALHEKAPRGSLFNIPNTTGVGIGDGHVKITVTAEHALHSQLPKTVGGVPVVVETRPPISHHQVEGGQAFAGRNTLFGVVVDGSGNRFLMGCAHSFAYLTGGQVVVNGKTVGQFTRSALRCGQTDNHLDASIAAVSPGVSTSFDIIGLGTPRGTAEPAVGQGANMQGIAGGRKRGTVTMINYDFSDTYPEFNGCSVTHRDLFETNNSGLSGDSISNDSMLIWKEDENLKYGTIEDLFLSYNSSTEREKFTILSVGRDKRRHYRDKNKFSVNTGIPIFNGIKNVVYHGIKPVWKITLRNGKSIEITKDHSLFCSSGLEHYLKSKPLDALRNVISVDDIELIEGRSCNIDDDMLIFMGLWMADGSYSWKGDRTIKDGLMISTGNNPEIKEWLMTFSERFRKPRYGKMYSMAKDREAGLKTKEISVKYGVTTTAVLSAWFDYKSARHGKLGPAHMSKGYSCKSNGDFRIYSREAGAIIYGAFGEVDSYTKRVPKFLFTSTIEQICLFLKGYFSGDGSVHTRKRGYGEYLVDCASVNRYLLEDISLLLDRVGIKHATDSGYTRGLVWSKYQQQLQYKLRIEAGHAVNKFMEKIGVIKRNGFVKRTKFTDKIYRPLSVRGIRRIEYIGEKPVYDISVDKTEAFVANGILCHNSGSACWNDQGYIMGIHFAGSSNGSIGLQGNVKYLQSDLGVHLGVGAPAPISLHTAPQTAPSINPLLVVGGILVVGAVALMR